MSDLDRLLRRSLELHSRRPAVVIGQLAVTYGELFDRAHRLSAIVLARCPPGGSVGILAEKSLTAYVAPLACVLAGRPYVPVSMKAPLERQRMIAQMGRCRMLVSDARSRQRHGELDLSLGLEGSRIGDETLDADLADVRADAPPPTSDKNLAYVIFTSGTTGVPKGVAVRRANLKRYLEAIDEVAPFAPGSRCTQLPDLAFDLSVHDLWRTWANGGALHVARGDEALDPVGFAMRHSIQCWVSVPSLISTALRMRRLAPGSLPELRLSLFCGEALSVNLAEAWGRAAPNSRIINLYGPTETTCAITAYEFTGPLPGTATVPLGRPFRGSDLALVGEDGAEVGPGDIGEIWLAGGQVSQGYVDDVRQTRMRYVRKVFPGRRFSRWFRTRDLARNDERLGLVFEGRIDDQIKILGYRAELFEIEEHLRRAAGSSEVAVVPWPLTAWGSAEGVVGFVGGGASATARNILRACRATLPSYMVPKRIEFIDRLPLGINGKVDRTALRLRLDAGQLPPTPADAAQ